MYPNLYYVFRDLFGVEWNALRYVNSFGFFVALSFILAALVLTAELKRKSKQGLFKPTEVEMVVGKPATAVEIIINFILGFLLGYKIVGLFLMNKSATDDPQAFIFSTIGNWPAGILLGLFFAGFKWWEKNKQKLPKPEKRKIRIWPQDRVGEITIIALVLGLLGAKLFDIFENWSDFLQKPSAYLFSPSGLTFYGGLICAALGIWWYAYKHKIGFWYLNDAAAPALMLSYGTGRMGCQVAGDGDWGVFNSAYTVDNVGVITKGTLEQYHSTVQQHAGYFNDLMTKFGEVPHLSFTKPSYLNFLPDWFFAYDYPHNVNTEGVNLAGCMDEKFCAHLPVPVIPTPLYEIIMCLVLFGVLWFLRKKIKVPGALFSIYLIFNGIERFVIERIRVNNPMNLFGLHPSQAQVISFLLILTGVSLFIYLRTKAKKETV